jgi:hypothetical protein
MQPNNDEIDELIRLGGMAPSGGNMQPWKVLVRPGALEVSLRPERAGSFLDVGCLASVFSVGSFVENVALGSAWLGLKYEVEVHDFRQPSDRVATIRYLGRGAPDRNALFEQITRRHTNRHLHQGPTLSDAVIDGLRKSIGDSTSVRLCCLSDAPQRKAAAEILGKGSVPLIRHPVLFSQMMTEIRWSEAEADRSRDGVALGTLELPSQAALMLRVLRGWPPLRKLLPRGALAKMPEPSILGCSHLCVLAVRGDLSTQGLVNAGRALQRVWLEATRVQLAIQPLSTLPFLVLRAERFAGAGLSTSEARDLSKLGAALKAVYSLEADEFPLFIFRLSRPVAAASQRALRLPHQSLYSSPA